MRARDLKELGLLSLSEQQTGESVVIQVHKMFLQGGKCGCEMEKE